MEKKTSKQRRIKLKVSESNKHKPSGTTLKKLQDLMGAIKTDVILETVYEDVEGVKQSIESWYDKQSPNVSIVGGLDYEVGLNRLAQLRVYKSNRTEKYNWFRERSTDSLKEFLSLILNNPDIICRSQITQKRLDSGKIVTIRDFQQTAAPWYLSAEKAIRKVVEKQNNKLIKNQEIIGFQLPLVDVTINNPLSGVIRSSGRTKEISILFIKDLAQIIKPYLPLKKDRGEFVKKDRGEFVKEVLMYFYGIPERDIELKNITEHC